MDTSIASEVSVACIRAGSGLDLDSDCPIYLPFNIGSDYRSMAQEKKTLSEGQNIRRVAIFYHPRLPAARTLAEDLLDILSKSGVKGWYRSAWDEETTSDDVGDRDLLISVGGDGTMLRVSHLALPCGIPVLGVNMGRVGFMNELNPEEARTDLPRLMADGGRIEHRATLQAEIVPPDTFSGIEGDGRRTYFALNDVVVARGRVARVIRIEARIDGDLFTTYKGDGVIIATATGSTSYSMAAGGPILNPLTDEFVLNPIDSHLTISNALVLPPSSKVELTVSTDHEVIMSVDGQIEADLEDGYTVSATINSNMAKFLRFQPPGRFYSTVTERLTRME